MANQKNPQNSAAQGASTVSASKGIDLRLYFKAFGIFFKDFFGKNIPYFFKNFVLVMKGFSLWFNKQTNAEKIAYAMIPVAFILIIVGILI